MCIIEWCNKPVKSRGLCSRHYERFRQGRDDIDGDPNRTPQGTEVNKTVYAAWTNMRSRCDTPSSNRYYTHGARGISYDPAWNSYARFESDMLPTWKEGLTLDRIDNDGNYNKDNCRWATYAEQNQNSRNCKLDWEKVREIRQHFELGVSAIRLAREFGVTRRMIDNVVYHRAWKEDASL